MPTLDNLQEAEGKTEKKLEKIEIAEDQKTNLNFDNINDSKKESNSSKKNEFESMGLEDLVSSFENFLKNENIEKIRPDILKIRSLFNNKFNKLIEENKNKFVSEGGNIIDFTFSNKHKKKFNSLSKIFRDKNTIYEKNKVINYEKNLELRKEVINGIKELIDINQNTNTSYNKFRSLQDQWRLLGKVPAKDANNVWNNYRHHVERFYDFLHLDRDLRDKDYKYNLEKKQKLIEKVKALSDEKNLGRAFRELQALHKIWKNELGPVAKEFREKLWKEFSDATKIINEKRKIYNNQVEERLLENLKFKKEIIKEIKLISDVENNNHSEWQKGIKEIEYLKEKFFKIGGVPRKENNMLWSDFKSSVRVFNNKKNNFYKLLKKEQTENLRRKQELTDIAEQNKDSENFDTTLVLMKSIQNQWKEIGHIPRKQSNKLWKRFKSSCNHFFDRYHEINSNGTIEENEALKQKQELLETLKSFKIGSKKNDNIKKIKDYTTNWTKLGVVPKNKKNIDNEFYKIINTVLRKIGVDESELKELKYLHKIQELMKNPKSLNNEITFVRNKIEHTKSEINQFENNLQFFSNTNEDNPMIIDVKNKIYKQKNELENWTKKLSNINKMIK